MSKAQHTPGPWITRGWDIFAGPLPIATAVYIGYKENVGEAERDSNARLIAAAPDLLAALEAVSGRWDGCPIDQCPREVKDARAAIAKAKGE